MKIKGPIYYSWFSSKSPQFKIFCTIYKERFHPRQLNRGVTRFNLTQPHLSKSQRQLPS